MASFEDMSNALQLKGYERRCRDDKLLAGMVIIQRA